MFIDGGEFPALLRVLRMVKSVETVVRKGDIHWVGYKVHVTESCDGCASSDNSCGNDRSTARGCGYDRTDS
jgi:hypothetical protein